MLPYLLVAAGSAAGGIARYGTAELAMRWFGAGFPWGTLIVNVAGSFAMGLLNALTTPSGHLLLGSSSRQLIMIGALGGYTTFSAFSLQSLELMRQGHWPAAAGNVIGSMLLCLVAVWLGHLTATFLNR
jgi:CrcB protein